MYMCVYVCFYLFAYMCGSEDSLKCHSLSGIINLIIRDRALELTDSARLADLWSPGILLSMPLRCWNSGAHHHAWLLL